MRRCDLLQPVFRTAVTTLLVLVGALGASRPVSAETLVLEHGAPAAIVGLAAEFLEHAGSNGLGEVSVTTTDAEGAEVAVGAGEFLMTVVPIERFADLVRASDLYSVPFLMRDAEDRTALMRRDSRVRTSFDTVTVVSGVRILAMLPVGYEGIAMSDVGDVSPAAFDSIRVLADGPAERGLVGAVQGMPVERGRHAAAVLAPWEIQFTKQEVAGMASEELGTPEPYGAYFDLRHAPTVFVLVVNQQDWVAMSDEERAILEATALAVEDGALDMLDQRHDHELDRLRAGGMEILTPDESMRMEWSAMTAGLSRATYLGEGAQLARVFLRAVDRTLSSN